MSSSLRVVTVVFTFLFGGLALWLANRQMKPGFGPYNLKVFGLIIVATLVVVVTLAEVPRPEIASGVLGAIAGYLFGIKAEDR